MVLGLWNTPVTQNLVVKGNAIVRSILMHAITRYIAITTREVQEILREGLGEDVATLRGMYQKSSEGPANKAFRSSSMGGGVEGRRVTGTIKLAATKKQVK